MLVTVRSAVSKLKHSGLTVEAAVEALRRKMRTLRRRSG